MSKIVVICHFEKSTFLKNEHKKSNLLECICKEGIKKAKYLDFFNKKCYNIGTKTTEESCAYEKNNLFTAVVIDAGTTRIL